MANEEIKAKAKQLKSELLIKYPHVFIEIEDAEKFVRELPENLQTVDYFYDYILSNGIGEVVE